MSEQRAPYRVRRLPLDGLVTVPSARPRNRGAYRRGAAFERELLADFRRRGLLAVRSAGSAGPYDVYVPLDGGGLAVQCKALAAEPAPAQLRRWLAALPPLPAGWRGILMVKTPRGWQRHDAALGTAALADGSKEAS